MAYIVDGSGFSGSAQTVNRAGSRPLGTGFLLTANSAKASHPRLEATTLNFPSSPVVYSELTASLTGRAFKNHEEATPAVIVLAVRVNFSPSQASVEASLRSIVPPSIFASVGGDSASHKLLLSLTFTDHRLPSSAMSTLTLPETSGVNAPSFFHW